MLSQELQQHVAPRIRVMQAIVAAIIMGAIMFCVCIGFIANWENYGEPMRLLTLIGGFAGVCIYILSFVLPFMFSKVPTSNEVEAKGGDPGKQSETIINLILNMVTAEIVVRAALIDGAIFLNLVVFLLDPHIVSLVIAGIGILLLLFLLPRSSKIVSVVEDRLQDFGDQKSMGM
ncbi:MAG: hypothetical protein AB8B55_11635 [Mariniblastus sp.]